MENKNKYRRFVTAEAVQNFALIGPIIDLIQEKSDYIGAIIREEIRFLSNKSY